MDLTKIFKPGMVINATASVQTDFHQFNRVPSKWEVVEVYPHWINCRNLKHQKVSVRGTTTDKYDVPVGRRASFNTGDLAMSGLLR